MNLNVTVFTEVRFWALVLCSLVLPITIFVTLFVRREFSKVTILGFGLLLILLAGVDIFLLRILATMAQATPSLADDAAFSSAISIALYIFPAAFGTIGLNMASHVLMHYLKTKEERFEAHQATRLASHGRSSPMDGERAQNHRAERRLRPSALRTTRRRDRIH
jgi:hypothetical protein